MKLECVCVLLIILAFLCCQAHEKKASKPKREKKVKNTKCMCKKCDRKVCAHYNNGTQYCCQPIGKQGLCCAEHIHDQLNCSGGVYNFGPDNCNCQMYYHCYKNELFHFVCPVGGAWTNDSTTSACLQLYDPKIMCGDRPFLPPTYIARFIEISFIFRNSTVSPPVDLLTFSGVVLQGPLYNIMLAFAATRTDFSFYSKYHPVYWRLGTCINDKCGVWVPDKTYWSIKHNRVSIPVGISKFVPDNKSEILFDFIVWAGSHS